MIASAKSASAIALATGAVFCLVSCAAESKDRAVRATGSALATTQTINASGDTYIRSLAANQNQGGDLVMRVQALGNNRPLVFFDNAAIRTAVQNGTLVRAEIEMTIDGSPIGWGATGRPIAIHRLAKASGEYGATWNCAIDSSIQNAQANCSGVTAWNMAATTPATQPWQSSVCS